MVENAVAKGRVRIAHAEELLELKNNFFRFRDIREDALPDETTGFEETQRYKHEMEDYFRYRLDYFPNFEVGVTPDPLRWVYYADLHDEIVEDYFTRDFDIRSNITAYRIATERNQWRHIVRKRGVQIAISLLMYAVLIFAPFGAASLFGPNAQPTIAFFALTGVTAVTVVVLTVLVFEAATELLSTRLRDAFEVNATNLSKKIQHRFANLFQNYTIFTKNLSEEEFNTSDLDNRDWIERCAWWVKVAMWNAKRVEYCEKFFQSEMQRLRIFVYVTDPLGNLTAILAVVVLLLVPFGLAYVLQLQGLGLDRLLDKAAHGGLGIREGVALCQLALATVGAVVTTVLAFMGTRAKHSILLSDIRKWITEHEWKRFADIGLHEDIASIIRRDKDRIRQEKMRGGFGSGHNRGGPM